MNNDYPNLDQFLGGYFHEDFLLDAPDAIATVKIFCGEASEEEIRSIASEIRTLLSNVQDERDLGAAVARLGSCYNPQADGLSFRHWLESVAATLESRNGV